MALLGAMMEAIDQKEAFIMPKKYLSEFRKQTILSILNGLPIFEISKNIKYHLVPYIDGSKNMDRSTLTFLLQIIPHFKKKANG